VFAAVELSHRHCSIAAKVSGHWSQNVYPKVS